MLFVTTITIWRNQMLKLKKTVLLVIRMLSLFKVSARLLDIIIYVSFLLIYIFYTEIFDLEAVNVMAITLFF